jgi:hypothetical protein
LFNSWKPRDVELRKIKMPQSQSFKFAARSLCRLKNKKKYLKIR